MSHTHPPPSTGLGRAPGHRQVALAGIAALLFSSVLVWPATASASPSPTGADVDPAVYAQLAGGSETEFVVYLAETADLSAAEQQPTRAAQAEFVYSRLTSLAGASQAGLRELLDARGIDYTSYWAVNALLVEGDRDLVDELAARADVAAIESDRQFEVRHAPEPEAVLAAVGWNIADIGADRVWDVFGVRGERVTVATIDTGVEYTHEALVRQYRGTLAGGGFDHNYHWFDATGSCRAPEPCDDNGHGTHITGTMVGDDGGDNQIGVAPGARWIAAKACTGSGTCSLSTLLAAGQWMLAPTDLNGQNPLPSRAPHVVSNSWGGPGGNLFFEGILNAWVAAGIFPVFALGGSGPVCGSAGSPADNPAAYAVGAYNSAHAIAPFSARGPSSVDGTTVKPNVTAPGVSIRSAFPGGIYNTISGTSTATPHVAGTVALIWSARPSATLRDVPLTRAIIDATAISASDLSCGGTPANNNVWGQGRLDAFQAVWLSLNL